MSEGQRVCAFWSTQYRHLYPGFIRTSSPHPNLVFVEFDDGDNGRIPIEDIRLLPQDYPKMKLNADPLKNLERRRRMSSCGKDGKTASKSSDEKTKLSEEKTKVSVGSLSKTKDSESKPAEEPKKIITKLSKGSNANNASECLSSSVSVKTETRLKKKRKHAKDDRHHRHHHKHHRCRQVSINSFSRILKLM